MTVQITRLEHDTDALRQHAARVSVAAVARRLLALARLSQLVPNNPPGEWFPMVGSCKVGTTRAVVISITEYHPT
jgi:hypothetical protein